MPSLPDRITITLWRGLRIPDGGERVTLTWPELCAFLAPAEPPVFAGEGSPAGSPMTDAGHPGWSPAAFRGDYRAKDRISEVGALALEHDSGTVPLAQALEVLTALGFDCIVITTKSHTPEHHRYRIVVRLSRAVSVEEREHLYQFAMTWGLDLAISESRDPSRFWFTTCRGAHPSSGVATILEGAPLDVDAVLAAVPPPSSPPAPPTYSPPRDLSHYIGAALQGAYTAIATAQKGSRHDAVCREAYSLGGLLPHGLPRAEAERVLRLACDAAWKDPVERDRDGYRTIRQQLDLGESRPRSIPDRPAPSRGSALPANDSAPSSPVQPPPTARHLHAVPDNADDLYETIKGVKALLLHSSSGSPRKVVANATTIFSLDPRWSGVLAYQALSDRVVKLLPPRWHAHDAPATNEVGPWTDSDTTRTQAWLSREYGLDLGADACNAAIQAAAENNTVDPLRDYFAGIRGTWDGVERLDLWLTTYLGVPASPYSRAIGRRFLLGAVARALVPRDSTEGEKVDNVPILEGAQGMGKSTALRKLCPIPGLFFDDDLPIGDKDAAQAIRGKFIVELGELSALSRHDFRLIKGFVTRQVDTYRPSFGRVARDFPRRCVFVGSTNDDEYLKDPTGNRRWWPVRCGVVGPIDWSGIERDRDQLWAEALMCHDRGDPRYVDSEDLRKLCEAEQARREQGDPWEERVAAFLTDRHARWDVEHHAPHPPAGCPCVYCSGVTASAVLSAIGLSVEKQTRAEEMRVAVIIKALGWKRAGRKRIAGARVYPYVPGNAHVDEVGPEVGQ
ncbi:MAG: hypothetical protein EKK62_12910 [Acidimicrobiia bacterium]|nr:MAG: hypothetical protein EKK62_12910 [Acidimicrobiia bacterium]